MQFKDYYALLGIERTASQDDIKRAYRKLARKYHPDVSKEPGAEAKFKDVAEAYAALKDVEKRAAYDTLGQGQANDQEFRPPPGWDGGFEFSGRGPTDAPDADRSDFFEALFGRGRSRGAGAHAAGPSHGGDQHARIQIELRDCYLGARRHITLRVPQLDSNGDVIWQPRELEVNIPKGIRDGQHLRLAGQGSPALGGAAGDLYLEIAVVPDPRFRVDGRDVYTELPVSPWEAALGTSVAVATPDGSVQLTVPPGSSSGRRLRLRGKGIPGNPAGDLYAVLGIAIPPADSDAAQAAYRALATACADFNPRAVPEV